MTEDKKHNFYCYLCKYSTSKSADWLKHQKTRKHLRDGISKTTICNILLSLIPPTNGKIVVNDKFNIFKNISNYKRLISF
jgi:ABC-type antimicrobial peptide transport system ATPase subunit